MDRSRASACSICRGWSPARSPACCWPTSAPTSSRSSSRGPAIRCASGRPSGEPFWWKVYARNKRFITLNLKVPRGRELARATAAAVRRGGGVVHAGHARAPRPGLGRPAGLASRPDPAPHLGVGTERPRQRAPRLRHARRGGQRICGDERRSRRRADRSQLPARRHDRRLSPPCNAVMFALYQRDRNGGRGQVIDLSLFESLFSVLGPLSAEYAALGRARTRQGQPIEERRSARLLPDQRRPLDGGQRIHAEDGRAVPAQLRSRPIC